MNLDKILSIASRPDGHPVGSVRYMEIWLEDIDDSRELIACVKVKVLEPAARQVGTSTTPKGEPALTAEIYAQEVEIIEILSCKQKDLGGFVLPGDQGLSRIDCLRLEEFSL